MHKLVRQAEIGSVIPLPLALIKPNPDQPRKWFDPLSIESLGASCLKKADVHQPILVVKCDNDSCVMIVDGERRWRAATHVGLEAISCLIQPPMTELEMYMMSAVTNFGREDMSPIEEAHAMQRIMDSQGMSQGELATLVGKHPTQISSLLKYLKLDKEIQALVITRKLDKGVALQLATYKASDQQSLLKTLEMEVAVRGGKRIHPNEASRFLRGVAEKRGLQAAQTKRGRELTTHGDLTVRNLMRNIELTKKSLQELNGLPVKSIKSIKGLHFLDIMQELQQLHKQIEAQISRLNKMD